MKKSALFPSGSLLLLLIALVFLTPSCEGDEGATGSAGRSATRHIADALKINPAITAASINSPPTVQFTLKDENKTALTGLLPEEISLTIARLVPGSNGDSSAWQSYLTRIETAGGPGPGTRDQFQATTENGADGTLIDRGDGSYTYTFAVDLARSDLTLDRSLTHRIGFEIRGLAETTGNAAYTFRPSDGATTGLFSREIVKLKACNACHDQLALHGSARLDTQYCVTCHNPGSSDANSGNTLDFKVMIHKIHRGRSLPSVQNGGEYAIWGFGDSKHDYSKAVWPQDIRNCRTCHDENDPETPNAGNWLSAPTMEACGSCHDDVDFATGKNHSTFNIVVTTNASCTLCHRAGGFLGGIDQSHRIREREAAAAFQFNLIDIANTSPGAFPIVVFSITDPTKGDAPYNIKSDAPFVQAGTSRVAIDIGWDTTDYQNTGSGSLPASMGSLNPLGAGSINNGNGTFSISSTLAIPSGVTGSGMVSLEGRAAVDVDGNGTFEQIGIAGATKFFPITDAAAVKRRAVVSIEKCNVCHKTLSLHGANRTDNIDQCLGCHNPNNTDISRRPANLATALDGKKEEAIDFKRMIHALHAGPDGAGLVVYGFGNTAHDFREIQFPGKLSNCAHCHVGTSYYPVGMGVLATTLDTGADRSDPLDDINVSPNTSACSACHNSTLALQHMKQNGGAFDVTQAADRSMTSIAAGAVVETCGICHGPNRLADVKKVHGFQ